VWTACLLDIFIATGSKMLLWAILQTRHFYARAVLQTGLSAAIFLSDA